MPKKIERLRTMTLNLSNEEMDALEALASRLGTSKSALIRQWIHDAISRYGLPDLRSIED